MRAFAWLDIDRARRLAARADADAAIAAGAQRPPLFGVTLGVKDIFDTAGIPTEYGSAVFRGRVPAATAPVVSALEEAGAIAIGKTVSSGAEPRCAAAVVNSMAVTAKATP